MKIKLFSLLLLSSMSTFISCKKDTETVVTEEKTVSEKTVNGSNPEAVKMLTTFYHAYLDEIVTATDLPASEKRLDSLRMAYCDPKLIAHNNAAFENEELDYDPFINAQDADESMRDSVTIKYVENSNNQYEVSCKSAYSDEVITVLVTVGEINGEVKIVALE